MEFTEKPSTWDLSFKSQIVLLSSRPQAGKRWGRYIVGTKRVGKVDIVGVAREQRLLCHTSSGIWAVTKFTKSQVVIPIASFSSFELKKIKRVFTPEYVV